MEYITVEEVMNNLLDNPLLEDIKLEQVIRHTIDFIRLIKAPQLFTENRAILKIEDYKAKLPCDFYSILAVRTYNCNVGVFESMRAMTGFFDNTCNNTYKIQGSNILVSFEKGEIEIAYNAIKVDDNGYPLIPDVVEFTRALELYIKRYYFQQFFEQGKINAQVLEGIKQDYSWAVYQAQNIFKAVSIDEMESAKNMLQSWSTRNQHKEGFVNLGTSVKLKIH